MSSGGIFKTPLTTQIESTSVKPPKSEDPHRIFTRKCNIILALIFLFVLGIALALALTFKLRHQSSSPFNSTPPSPPPSNSSFWAPTLNSTRSMSKAPWNIELLVSLDPSNIDPNTTIYDIDLFLSANTTPSVIGTLHSRSHKVICYFSAGTIETFRPDASQFYPKDYGAQLSEWTNEYWANISSPNVRNIMRQRLDLAANQSCDAVDPDNIDGYSNKNGLGLTQSDSIDYMEWLIGEAHARGLGIGLKNGGEIIPQVLKDVQFAVNEQCVQYQECTTWLPFIDAVKPVFHIEYPDNAPTVSQVERNAVCGDNTAESFFTILKRKELDDWMEVC